MWFFEGFESTKARRAARFPMRSSRRRFAMWWCAWQAAAPVGALRAPPTPKGSSFHEGRRSAPKVAGVGTSSRIQHAAPLAASRRPVAMLRERVAKKVLGWTKQPSEEEEGVLSWRSSALPVGTKKRAAVRQREARAAATRRLLNLPEDPATMLMTSDGRSGSTSGDREVMVSYCLAEEFDTSAIVDALAGRAVLVGDVAAVGLGRSVADPKRSGPPIAFIFPFGGAVLWGFSDADVDEVLNVALQNNAIGALPAANVDKDTTTFRVAPTKSRRRKGTADGPNRDNNVFGTTPSELYSDLAALYTAPTPGAEDDPRATGDGGDNGVPHHHQDPPESKPWPAVSFSRSSEAPLVLSDADDALIKLSVSYAFAQSARLGTLEAAADDLIEEISPIPEALAATGKCKQLSSQSVARLDGRAFLLSSALNLYSDILDVPDFFWDNEEYQSVYERTASYLDVPDRASILNARLNVIQQLLTNLSSRLDVSHSTKLEWVIIILIVLEVIHVYDPLLRTGASAALALGQRLLGPI